MWKETCLFVLTVFLIALFLAVIAAIIVGVKF